MSSNVTIQDGNNYTVEQVDGNTYNVHTSQGNMFNIEVNNNGLSAYELAVKNGFNGSEEDFTNSLIDVNAPDYTLIYNVAKL